MGDNVILEVEFKIIDQMALKNQKNSTRDNKQKFEEMMESLAKLFKNQDLNPSQSDEDMASLSDFFKLPVLPITVKEWQESHPANLKCGSDQYYADLANEIADIVARLPLPSNIPAGFCEELGRVLATYLEDLVSGTKVFKTMRNICQDRYGYQLPFYNCEHEDYMPDHINEEDIKFLVWKTACQLGQESEMTYSPLAPGWKLIADKVFDCLNKSFETAPDASRITDWLHKSLQKGEYLQLREIALWLVLRNPLTYFPDVMGEMIDEVKEMEENAETSFSANQIMYSLQADFAWQRSMSPMGCSSMTFVAALAREFGCEANAVAIEEMRVLPKQFYKLSQDTKSRNFVLETSDHKELIAERNSFAKGVKVESPIFVKCSLVFYKGRYLLNGLMTGGEDFYEDWKKSSSITTLEQQQDFSRQWISEHDGQQVIFGKNIEQLLEKLGFPVANSVYYPKADNYVALVSKTLGVAFLPDAGYAFQLPGNRSFRKRRAASESFLLISNNSIPLDVALYIQSNHLLPEAQIFASQGKETGKKIVQDYLAFWIGFYCRLPEYGASVSSAQSDLL